MCQTLQPANTATNIFSSHFILFGSRPWKGPCDGIGGALKRMADDAVKQSKSIIQKGKDFFEWGVNSITLCTTYIYYTNKDVKISFDELMGVPLMPIKGTMKIDFVVSSENGVIYC